MAFSIQPRKEIWLHSALLVIAILVAYSKVFNAGFMNWDDLDYVFNTPDINSGISAKQIKNWFTTNYLGNYQPLPVFTYALDHVIGGKDPFIYHLHSLLWHIAAMILLYFFICRIQENKWVAFFVAMLFAIHPVQTESVSWIAARNKSMNTVFYFAALYYYISYLKTDKIVKLVWVTVYGLLAYLCKATALALPLALFAVDIWWRRPLNNKRLWLEKLPLVLIGIPVAMVTLTAQEDVTFLQHHSGFGWSNFVFAGYAFVQYIIHLILPLNLSVLYPYPPDVNLVHFICFVVAILIGVIMIISYRKGWYMWTGGILFFTVNLLPVLQLVQFGETIMADRYLYIACIGLWFPLVYHFFRLFENRNNTLRIVVVSLVCTLFLAMTFFRNNIWLNEINFWNSVLDKFPESTVAHYSIGGAYMKEGDLNKAELHMNQAVRFDPGNYKAWRNKGSLHLRQGKPKQALYALNRSLEIFPYPKAYFTRALLYHNMHNYELTIEDLNKVLEQEPKNARAYYIKADCEEQLGQPATALENYTRAIANDENEPLFLIRRGLLHAKSGNKQEAFNDLDKAVALKPDNGEALYYRGLTRYGLGLSPCNDLQEALRNGFVQAREVIGKLCQ